MYESIISLIVIPISLCVAAIGLMLIPSHYKEKEYFGTVVCDELKEELRK